MRKKKNIQGIALLMILSQTLLTLFVFQRLHDRYGQEKDLLKKDLGRVFQQSRQELCDSMLQSKVIDPLLAKDDSMHIRVHSGEDSLVMHVEEGRRGGHFKKIIRLQHNSRMMFYKGDSGLASPLTGMKHPGLPGAEEELLLREIRLLVNKARAAKSGSAQSEELLIQNKADTALFRKLTADNMQKSGFNLSVNWGAPRKDSELYFESNLFSKAYGLNISRCRLYLSRKMWPEAGFSLVLLFITALAFYLSFRNMTKQIRLNVLKDDFISNISHELKTPVSTIKLSIEALQHFDTLRKPEVIKEYLQMAGKETERLEILINKVMDASVMEGGGLVMERRPVDIVLLIEEAVESLRLRIEKQQAEIKTEKAPGNYIVPADPVYLRGVILNLLDNSLKYRPADNRVGICISRKEEFICVKIIDNGPGVPAEYMDQITGRFFRVPSQQGHVVKGHGLGLNYSAEVIRLHGGKMVVKNGNGGGLSVELLIPALRE